MDTSPLFDADLIRRYDIAGPRYTSYPTAPHFHARFGEANYRAQALASNASERDLSLYLHLPYCTSPCYYCGCLRLITRNRSKIESYLEYLLREMALVAPLFARGRRVTQLHLGGGTPNLLNDEQLARLMAAIHRYFDVADEKSREFGIEVDPRTTTPAAVHVMAKLGIVEEAPVTVDAAPPALPVAEKAANDDNDFDSRRNEWRERFRTAMKSRKEDDHGNPQ